MLRRQFPAGAIAVTSLAVLPATALAKRGGGFKFFSKTDSPATRTRKIWIYSAGGGVFALVAIGRAVFWVMNRLEENPGRPRSYDLPPPAPSSPTMADATVTVSRKGASSPSFGRRTV